ncbi:GroES-like protein [Paraphaeosphaeria sporulosa]|uniref:GroES-like protein n=1 Tax=Paraphaeosphaeria sporulosa TaxID=1460663 RepID=A0A177CTW9_9PLEO|nr:GroES-like protein [Paraphaeosphaeria sporulosa]OAG10696.1 GroES-like protein [Paraphaeosphaeria sporulosa]
MKAAQWDPAQQKVVVNEVPKPTPGPGQFLVRLASASLCHSDLMSMAMPHEKPITIGHEGAGYIEEIHSTAENKGFKVGDGIGFTYIVNYCDDCEGCAVHNNHCLTKKSRVHGFDEPGLFAEYAAVDATSCIILPQELSPETSSPIFCGGITAFHCVDSCELKPGQWLAIIGCGGLGQLAVQYAKAMGFKVIGIDINDDILSTAKSQGADAVFNSRSNPNFFEEAKAVMNRGPNKGADAVAVFSAATAAYKSAPPLVKLGGIIMVVGLPAAGVTFDALDIARGTYRVKGDSTGVPKRMKKAIDFTAKHRIKPEIEIHKSLDAVNEMVERMKKGELTRRQLVQFV